jgi:hypothetical protein
MEHALDATAGPAVHDIDAAGLRRFLRESMPEYMIPEHIRFWLRLPRTTAGKLDARALPRLNIDRASLGAVCPSSELQSALAGIWREVLEVEAIGVTDDFFDAGGHSLRAVRMLALVAQRLSAAVSLRGLDRSRLATQRTT